jgi:hypothetical protein
MDCGRQAIALQNRKDGFGSNHPFRDQGGKVGNRLKASSDMPAGNINRGSKTTG